MKNKIIAILTGIIVLLGGATLGARSEGVWYTVGGVATYSNGIDISGDGTATSSLDMGKTCWTIIEDGGDTYYAYFTAGDMTTTTTSCK